MEWYHLYVQRATALSEALQTSLGAKKFWLGAAIAAGVAFILLTSAFALLAAYVVVLPPGLPKLARGF